MNQPREEIHEKNNKRENPKIEKRNFYQDLVQEITLEYLTHNRPPLQCQIRQKEGQDQPKKFSSKDRKFYRKRILQLTKELLQPSNSVPGMTTDGSFNTQDSFSLIHKQMMEHPEVIHSFNQYIRTCIEHFKLMDHSDILQEEYKDLEDLEKSTQELDDILGPDDLGLGVVRPDDLLIHSVKLVKPYTMDRFVKKTVLKKPEEIPLPKQKKVDLKNPELKNKGICKKNNLTNT